MAWNLWLLGLFRNGLTEASLERHSVHEAWEYVKCTVITEAMEHSTLLCTRILVLRPMWMQVYWWDPGNKNEMDWKAIR